MAGGVRVLSSVLVCLSHALLICCSGSLSFRSEPSSQVVTRGSSVLLRCAPRPSSARVTWRFRALAPDSSPSSSAEAPPLDAAALPGLELDGASLTIPSLQPRLQGVYQCVAHSHAGAVASRLARVTIADIADYAETQRRSLEVPVGGTALIECPLPRSRPPALPRLRLRGERIEASTDDYLVLPSGNLQIVSASPQHQGTYKCGAYNPVTGETRTESHGTKLTVKLADARPAPVRIVYPTAPAVVSVEQSGSLVLECVVTGGVVSAGGVASPSARWLKEGREVSLGGVAGRRELRLNNLALAATVAGDAGRYQCSVQTGAGRTLLSANVTVNVLERVSVTRGLADQSLAAGSTALFSCAAEGSPAPGVTWLFNAEPLAASPRRHVSGASLRVTGVGPEDEGVYQCLLDNGVGSAQSAGRLTVQSGPNSAPTIVSPPRSGVYREGAAVWLSCNASGRPLPAIRWYDAAGPLATHPALLPLLPPPPPPGAVSRATAVSQPGSSALHIAAVTRAHAGTYVCRATNELGSARAEAVLSVEPTEAPPSVHPIQSDEGEGLEREGEGLEDAEAPPPPTTERSSDQPTPEAPIITSPPQTHKPDIYDLEWRAGRDWGQPINAYFVKYRKVDDIVQGGWHTVRVPGSEKTLRLAELEPSSLYEVLMVARSAAGEGQQAMLTFRTGKEKTTSVIKNPSKAPVVSQPAKAPEDKTPNTHFGVVIHDRVPEAPDRPTISMATESSVYVTWIPRANGGSPITAFCVEYRRGRSADWVVAADNISPLKLSVEVRSLEPGSTYRFRVKAVNMYGSSPHSIPSKPYQVSAASPRFSDRPVAGPHISSTDAVSDTQIMLRWTYTPSSNNNTPIQGFYIYYRPTDSDNDSDYKRDVVEGNQQWHLIGQLQPETSYDIKMQCFNDGGESEYSNVMICETRARQPPGVPSQPPVTPPGPFPPDPPSSAGGLLYLIVGCVLGVMVLILLVFIAMCLWKNRQQSGMHKYDPPGYLYQPAEMNVHVLEYTALPPGANRLNGSAHPGFGHAPGPLGAPQGGGCRHLHHKLPSGLALLNGSAGLYGPPHGGPPHGHEGSLPHAAMDYEHPHHHHNGGGMYTALPQADAPDCMSCQNYCNNNRCYTKANASFPGGTLPIMHRVALCQGGEGLEMMPLGQACSAPCRHGDGQQLLLPPGDPEPGRGPRGGEEEGEEEEEEEEEEEDQYSSPSLSRRSYCQDGENHTCPEETAEEEPQCVDSEGPVVCWERLGLGLQDLDRKEKTAWISNGSLAGELIQTSPQEA